MADDEKKEVIHKCRLCNAEFTDNKDKDAHYSGQFHKFMTGVRRLQLSYMGNAKTLNDQITETGKKESLVGLEYIYEYAEDSQGVRMYECKLCASAFRVASIFFHIVGIRHRILYLAKHHPIMGIEDDYDVQQQVHYRKLTNHTLAIEQTHGRKKLNVVEEVYVSKPNISEVSDIEMYLVDNIPSKKEPEKKKEENKDSSKETSKVRRGRERAEKYREMVKSRLQDEERDIRSKHRDRDSSSRRDSKDLPKYLIHDDDFDARNVSRGSSSASRLNLLKSSSSSDSKSDRRKRTRSPDRRSKTHSSRGSRSLESSGDIDVRSVLPSGGISFRDLKAANIGHLHGFSSANLPLCKKKKTKKTDKDSDSDMEVRSMDFSECEPDDFWCNEELFDYLKCYHVGDEEDVQFILEAIKILSHSLVRHKTRMEDLKKWIAQEKVRLEEEKKKFQDIKKRKDDKLTSTKISEPEMLKLFNEATRSQAKQSTGNEKYAQAAAQKAAVNITNLPQMTSLYKALVVAPGVPAVGAPGSQTAQMASKTPVQQAAQKPSANAQNVTPTQQNPISQKALMAGVGQLLQQLFLKPLAAANFPNPTPTPQFDTRGPVGGTKPVLGAASHPGPSQNPKIPGSRFDNPNPSKEQRPLPGQGVGIYPASHPGPSQNPKIPGSRFDDPNPSKEQRPLPGQGVGRYPAENVGPSQHVSGYQQLPGSSSAPVQHAGPRAPGSETRFAQNPEIPGSRFNNPDPSKENRPGSYPAPMNPSQPQQQAAPSPQDAANRFNQNSRSGFDMRGPVDGAGPGSETRFSQNQGPPASRFDNPNPPKDGRSMMGQATGRYPESDGRYYQNEAFAGGRTDNMGALNKAGQPIGADTASRFNQKPPSRFDTGGHVDGARAAPGPKSHFSQTPQAPVSRFDHPNASKDQEADVGQAASRYLESDCSYDQDDPCPGSWSDNDGSFNKAKPPSGAASEMCFSQNPKTPGSRFDNPNPSNQPKSFTGQSADRYPDSDGRYNQNEPNPSARTENTGSLDKTRPPSGAASEMRFSQNSKTPGSRFDNPNPSNQQKSFTGQTADRYPDSDGRYNQNEPYPSAQTENTGSLDKTRPPSGAASEMRFSQNPKTPGSRFDNPNPSNQPKSFTGQAADRYPDSDGRYNQNEPYPSARPENTGSLNKTRPPFGADQQGSYKQMAWSSGPPSGNQSFYNEARPVTGMGTGKYDDQYTQNQWQSQYSSRGSYGASMDRPPEPQSVQPQPAASTGYSSDGRPATWPSQTQPVASSGYSSDGRPATWPSQTPAIQPQPAASTGYSSDGRPATWPSQSQPAASSGYSSDGRPATWPSQTPAIQPQPAASTGYSSDGRPAAWPSQTPAKPGVYPAGILKNRITNPP